MAAGLSDELNDVECIVGLVDNRREIPNRPKTYEKKVA